MTVKSVSLRAGEMDPKKFFPWIEKVTQMQGPNILRLKGIIAIKDDPDRYVLQGVHMIIEGDHQRPWKDGETHESRLVFIGLTWIGGVMLLRTVLTNDYTYWQIATPLILMGIGMPLFFVPLTTLALGSVTEAADSVAAGARAVIRVAAAGRRARPSRPRRAPPPAR